MESPPYRGVKRAVTNCWWAGNHSSLLRPSRAHCSLLCDALHRASPEPERLGHLQDTHTLRKLLSHLPFGRDVYLRPAELHALGDGALETCCCRIMVRSNSAKAPVSWKTSLPIG